MRISRTFYNKKDRKCYPDGAIYYYSRSGWMKLCKRTLHRYFPHIKGRDILRITLSTSSMNHGREVVMRKVGTTLYFSFNKQECQRETLSLLEEAYRSHRFFAFETGDFIFEHLVSSLNDGNSRKFWVTVEAR